MAGSTPRVTFFVQAYNTAAYVRECLESILAQRGGYDLDVLVIDDASTDGTAAEIARIHDPRVRVIRHERNHGAMATANEGYLAAGGEFMMRIDSDDRLRPQFLERTVPRLQANPRLGFVYGDVATVDTEGRLTSPGGVVQRGGRALMGNEFFPLLMDNFLPAPSTLVRTAALRPLLPSPPGLTFVDWYVSTAIAETWDSEFVPEILAEYRVHPHNMHRTMILDRTGEATSLRILDMRLAGDVRRDEKRRWQRRVYASHFLSYAEKYFGVHMTADARRCYAEAIRRRPSLLLEPGIARRCAATLVGRRWYESAKSVMLHRKQEEPQ